VCVCVGGVEIILLLRRSRGVAPQSPLIVKEKVSLS